MLFPQAQYEIEFRCRFNSDEEAYQILPFLKNSLNREYTWFDNYHGREVFESGQVLRVSGVSGALGVHDFLGWKGPDQGHFANLRREYNEETSGGILKSAIMAYFCHAQISYAAPEIGPALDKAGYIKFMSYTGHSLTGRDEALGINTKLMHCQVLRWPILVELEKIAASESEALEFQNQLEEICRNYNLGSRVVKEEPGRLLHQKTFGVEG
jgi:hypothetical protein